LLSNHHLATRRFFCSFVLTQSSSRTHPGSQNRTSVSRFRSRAAAKSSARRVFLDESDTALNFDCSEITAKASRPLLCFFTPAREGKSTAVRAFLFPISIPIAFFPRMILIHIDGRGHRRSPSHARTLVVATRRHAVTSTAVAFM
jgi:hypothetical protein